MAVKYKKRADGRYLIQVQIGADENGKSMFKNIYARTIPELEKKASEFRQELERGVVVSDEGLTVSDWADKWLEVYKSGKEYNTKVKYVSAIKKHIKPEIGHYKLKDLRPHHVQELINKKHEEGLTRTLSIIKNTLNQMLEQAVTNQFIYRNVSKNIQMPNVTKPKKRSLTEAEKNAILKADLDLRSKAFVYLALYAGLRRGEILGLTKNDINLKGKTVTVSRNLIFIGNTGEIKPTPKTEAGNRIIPMPDILTDVLAEYIPTTDGIYLFSSIKSGMLITQTSYRSMWSKILNALNVAAGGKNGKLKAIKIADDITPHMFRHTYATSLYYAGVDIKTAQYLLGHASVQITLDIYTHLETEDNKEVANKLNLYYNHQATDSTTDNTFSQNSVKTAN